VDAARLDKKDVTREVRRVSGEAKAASEVQTSGCCPQLCAIRAGHPSDLDSLGSASRCRRSEG